MASKVSKIESPAPILKKKVFKSNNMCRKTISDLPLTSELPAFNINSRTVYSNVFPDNFSTLRSSYG